MSKHNNNGIGKKMEPIIRISKRSNMNGLSKLFVRLVAISFSLLFILITSARASTSASPALRMRLLQKSASSARWAQTSWACQPYPR